MKTIYLDNSATTPLCDAAKRKMTETMECYGNPSSLHPLGNEAHRMVEQARLQIALTLGVRRPEAGEILFTAGGSEADNLALIGAAKAKERRRGKRIIITDSEHSAVEKTARALEAEGFEIVRIGTKNGELDWEQYERALTDRVFLVSMMMVNNETGALYDLKRAFAMAKATNPEIVTHTDAVQGYLKCKFTPKSIGADMVSLSAHKIHGPKGVGALYVSPASLKRRDLVPVIYGGGQESGFRSGTENVIGIVGFGEAAREGFADIDAGIARMSELRRLAVEKLSTLAVRINQPKGMTAPHILSVTLPSIRSETMLHELSRSGICISNGSACSSHSTTPSGALIGFGLTSEQAGQTVRISFSPQNTEEDVEALCAAMNEALERLVRAKR